MKKAVKNFESMKAVKSFYLCKNVRIKELLLKIKESKLFLIWDLCYVSFLCSECKLLKIRNQGDMWILLECGKELALRI